MIDKYFKQKAAIDRLLANPIGPYLDALAMELSALGFTAEAIRRNLRHCASFGRYLEKKGIVVKDVNERVVDEYVESLDRQTNGWRNRKAAGLHQLLRLLRVHNLIADQNPSPHCFDSRFLEEFDEYLCKDLGFSRGTRVNYVHFVRRFSRQRFGNGEAEWADLRPEELVEIVQSEARRLRPSGRRQPVSAIKAWIRFLIGRGLVDSGLIGAVPQIRSWKQATLPQYISAADVEKLLAICEDVTPIDVRDRAILMTIARLGLRASETAELSLDDIDWSEARVLVRARKTKRERSLPLPQGVGDSIVSYLRRGRPPTPYRAIFLRCLAPVTPLSSDGITSVAIRRLRQAGISAPRMGAHVFRHTAATTMIRSGASFKEIADVLGHDQLETTHIYAKLDIDSLAAVAMPWPGGAP